jgi:hypothetical protein
MEARELDFYEANRSWRTKALVIGAVSGAVIGLLATYLLVQNAERQGRSPEISAGEGVRLGLLVLGLLRSVADLGEGDKKSR